MKPPDASATQRQNGRSPDREALRVELWNADEQTLILVRSLAPNQVLDFVETLERAGERGWVHVLTSLGRPLIRHQLKPTAVHFRRRSRNDRLWSERSMDLPHDIEH